MNGDEWVTTTDLFPEDLLRAMGLGPAMHGRDTEEIRARRMKSGRFRAYWTRSHSGYSPGHGGATMTVRWQPVRDEDTANVAVVEADTFDEVVAAVRAVWERGDLNVPTYGDPW